MTCVEFDSGAKATDESLLTELSRKLGVAAAEMEAADLPVVKSKTETVAL